MSGVELPDPAEALQAGATDLGVVIVSYNTRALLDDCLAALAAELRATGLAAETWVVDNASTDGSASLVTERHPWAGLIASDRNLGFTAANNRLLEGWARPGEGPEAVLLLNPDTALWPGALSRLWEAFRARPDAAVLGPALVYPDGRFQHAAFRFPGLVQTTLDLFPVARLMDQPLNGRYPARAYARGQPFPVDFVLGACMLVRRSAMQAVGPLDPGYFMYCEEIDWCHRFRAAGWRTLCVPGALVLHHAGASTGQFRTATLVQLWRSRRRYVQRHGGAFQRTAFAALLRLGLARWALRDRLAHARGRLDAVTLQERAAAYAAIRAPLAEPGPLVDGASESFPESAA